MRDIRLQEMEKAILEAGTISMDELCIRFGISMNTVRRDVAELEKRGSVGKVYGGVTALESSRSLPPAFTERVSINAEKKRECCRVAAQLIQDHDVIFVDSGTTFSALPDFIADRQDLTIITYNLSLLQRAYLYANLQVIVLPGQLRRKTLSLTGAETIIALKRYNIKKAFMATTGTTENTVTNSFANEFEIKQTAMSFIPEKILLLTKDKFGHPGLMNYASFSDFQTIVTDQLPEEPFLSSLRECGSRLITADLYAGMKE